ncbi:MAG: PIN domain-containing protein [Actinobacteria bacterium]|nr:PIN domain-containing protein [Actinomycetota bacterium]
MKIFLDTNIILDVLVKREPHYIDSARIWTLAKEQSFQGYISAITVNNFYYIVKKLKNSIIAGNFVDEILDDFKVVPLTKDILRQSRTIPEKDYEDSIQYFSAINTGCQFLITRNRKDFISKGLKIVSPADFLKTISGAASF